MEAPQISFIGRAPPQLVEQHVNHRRRQQGQQLARDQADWPARTDHDRLQSAFRDLENAGLIVLQGCEDHWTAKKALTDAGLRGVVWFTPPDVWHAIDEGMLEINVWHGNTANIAPGDELLTEVLAAFAAQGLEAHYDEGRVEVAAYWQWRPDPA